MKLAFIPAGDHTTASSRIRVFSLQNALMSKGVRTRLLYWNEANALIIQKRVDPKIINDARRFKDKGGVVIYDCDDLGKALHDWAPAPLFHKMLEIADVVTTNTTGFKEALRDKYGAKAVEIVPDVIDYFLTRPIKIKLLGEKVLRLLWFGNTGNLHLLLKYSDTLKKISSCELIICTDLSAKAETFTQSPFSFVPWSLLHFPQLLRSCSFTFLPHDGAIEDRAKSNNRMITSLAWGVPALASQTPEYERLAHEVETPECLFTCPHVLGEVIDRMRNLQLRRQYLENAQHLIWKRHSPDAVAARLLEVVNTYSYHSCPVMVY